MDIKILDGKLLVESEYNPAFVQAARRLGGKWESPFWSFDVRDEADVRALCLECYGTDGLTAVELVDLQVTIPEDVSEIGGRQDSIYLFGRVIARAWGRDSGAKLGNGIVIKQGGFSSGGSVKNWITAVQDGTVFIMRDVPKSLVDTHDNKAFIVEVIAKQSVSKENLNAEKELLIKRLAEIENLLNNRECL